MAKKNTKNTKKEEYATEEVFQDLDQFAQRTESFFEKNAKKFAAAFGIVVVGVLAYFAYLQYVQKPKRLAANEELLSVHRSYIADSLDQVLGDERQGAIKLVKEDGGLPAGKLAALFAGNAEYKKGNYQEALDYFKKYKSSDEITMALAKVAMGDCYVQLDENEKALSEYKKAINETDNGGTQLVAVKKAVIVGVETGKTEEALKILEKFKKEHPDTDNSGFVDAYTERLQAANGK